MLHESTDRFPAARISASVALSTLQKLALLIAPSVPVVVSIQFATFRTFLACFFKDSVYVANVALVARVLISRPGGRFFNQGATFATFATYARIGRNHWGILLALGNPARSCETSKNPPDHGEGARM